MPRIILLLLTIVLAAPHQSASAANQPCSRQAAIARINKVGGDVRVHKCDSGIKTEVFFPPDTRVTADVLAQLAALENVTSLILDGTKVSEHDLAALKTVPSLELLWLDDARLTHDGLTHIKGLASLRNLRLSRTRITDDGLAELKRLKKLERLYLDDTRVTDAGLTDLTNFSELELLSLCGCRITDKGLEQMHGNFRLNWLMSNSCAANCGLGNELEVMRKRRAACYGAR